MTFKRLTFNVILVFLNMLLTGKMCVYVFDTGSCSASFLWHYCVMIKTPLETSCAQLYVITCMIYTDYVSGQYHTLKNMKCFYLSPKVKKYI
jgi:hypothetical protein